MKKTAQLWLLFFLVLIVVILILINLFLPQFYAFITPEPEKTGDLSLTPTLVSEEDNLYKIDIKFKSGDDVDLAKPISAVAFSLSYPKDPNVEIMVVDENGVEVDKVVVGPVVSSNQWLVPINTITSDDSGVEIEFAAINTTPTGFTTSNYVTLGTVYLQSEEPLNEDVFVLTFNTDESAIISKVKPTEDILDTQGKLFYSVE